MSLKWPLLGCAVSLMALGCSTLPSKQAGSIPSSAGYPAATPMAAPETASRSPKWELNIPNQPAIETYVHRYSKEKSKSFQTQLDRAQQYVAPAQEIFEKAGLPKDLVFIALVESGFVPTARSRSNAVGMWQFISSTGKRFGLEQDEWVDERRHPFKAAQAAADYLSFLFDKFGSWELAIAAYNAGENGVQAALDQSGLKTFWELAENGYLPMETRDYVPKVLATVKIIRNPRLYGFHFNPQHYRPKHEVVAVPGGVKLASIEKLTGIPQPILQDHNPELVKPLTPPNCSDYELCVPVGTGESIKMALARLPLVDEKPAARSAAGPSKPTPSKQAVTLVKNDPGTAPKGSGNGIPETRKSADTKSSPTAASYTVQAGDTLYGLARKYECSVQDLAALNGVGKNQELKLGETIKVPAKASIKIASAKVASEKKEDRQKSAAQAADSRKVQSAGAKKAAGQPQKSGRQLTYPVRQGDTLWSIAKRFQISVDSLRASNNLKDNQKINHGDVLIICTNEQSTEKVAKRNRN